MSQQLAPAIIKRFKIGFYGICAIVIIALALILRIVLTTLGWTVPNSDEAVMQLMALHINTRGELPIFFYGQNYMGAIEAYAGAIMFRIFGVSVWSMRMTMILFFGGFLACMYFITSRIFTKSLALVTLVLLSIGASWTLAHQLESIGGYPEIPFLCALFFLLSYQLASSTGRSSWRSRLFLYALWGIVIGLALWTHLIVIPYVLVSGLLLVLFCWKELVKWGMWVVLGGLIIGAWPLIYYNLHATPGNDSISVFFLMSQMGSNANYLPAQHIVIPTFVTLPITLGLYPTCLVSQFPLLPSTQPHALRCVVLQGTWGIGYLTLLVIAAVIAIVAIALLWRRTMAQHRTFEEQETLVRQSARLMLLLGAALTFIVFIRSSTGLFDPLGGTRYLACMTVSLPAVLWPLWAGTGNILNRPIKVGHLWHILRIGIVIMVCAVSFKATLKIFDQIPQQQKEYQNLTQLADRLSEMHVTRFYTNYWTCNRIIFATHEKLICGDSYGDLSHGFDRYLPYRVAVQADPNPGFAYPVGSQQIDVLNQILQTSRIPCERVEIAGYVIFKPAHALPGLHF